MPSAPSLRELARALNLSHTTVSEALRGSPRVKPDTRRRVLEAATAAGYQRNPLAGALMSEMRRSRAGAFRGVLALLDVDSPTERPPGPVRYHHDLSVGASERAEELGFKVEPFSAGRGGMSLKRLDTILHARGIGGILVLPVREVPDLSRLDWSHFTGVYCDYIMEQPSLHCVCPDHHRAMFLALDELRELGYRRPGLVIHRPHDERLLFRWEAAYDVFHVRSPGINRLPPLISEELQREEFIAWFKREKPDVVLCHNPVALKWMADCGAKVPETHGFCSLNLKNADFPCAGLDLQPRLLGARAMEMLIGQVLRNEYGPPAVPSTTTVPAAWIPGPTLRSKQAATKRAR
jgi:DNA-binding LacI/PurR family transcriptional regulator